MFNPFALTWVDVNPASHPFDPVAAAGEIRALGPAQRVPTFPVGAVYPESSYWTVRVGDPWSDEMSRAIVKTFGSWSGGWRWGFGEADIDGGPIKNWCCSPHSISTPEATVETVVRAVLEWREWLEELADRFSRFLPIPLDASDADLHEVWERAVAHLVTVIVARTDSGSAWYGHCELVLSWFLTAAKIPEIQHRELLDDAIGGRFQSWSEPEPPVIQDVAARLAGALVSQRHGR